jgi:hypothetical protein
VDKQPPSRRSFIKTLTLTLSALSSQPSVAFAATDPKVLFYVAGTRFHRLRHAPVIGERVAIVEAVFRGERCYGIYSRQGERLGYVPYHLISAVQAFGTSVGRVVLADTSAVPWQRYRVALVSV